MAAGATYKNIGEFANIGKLGIISSILATFAIAPWAYVGFDTIPQAAEEFKFSHKKVISIMIESYIMLIIWVIIGLIFVLSRKNIKISETMQE